MRIERRKDGRGRAAQIREELGEILHGGMDGVPVCAADCPRAGPRPPLAVLQRDVDTIAGHLRDMIFEEARKLSRNAGSGAGSGAGG